MNLHSKKSRCGIVVHRDFFKLQLWNFRLYLSRVPMKPNLYAGTWKSFRKRMLKTSDKCAICGTQLNIATLSVHHIKPRSNGRHFLEGNYKCSDCGLTEYVQRMIDGTHLSPITYYSDCFTRIKKQPNLFEL